MNQQLLRVLVVEDSEDDADLMLRALRRGGYEPKLLRVDTPQAASTALDERNWDVVISDFVIPGFSGVAALELFKEKGLDVPFIFLSGQIGEDMAVSLMKCGAHDCIMKENLPRLIPAVERELREAAIRRGCKEFHQRVQEWTTGLAVDNAELQNQIQARVVLERNLMEIAERERRRRGLDTHAELSQKLMGISFLLKALERKIEHKQLPALGAMRKVQGLIHEVINHNDDLAHDFDALDLQGDDLALELKGLASKVRKMFQISCQFTAKGTVPKLPQYATAQFYKIALEAASNAIKHGHATAVYFALISGPGKVSLVVKDNGLPFTTGRNAGDGMGWRIMHSRASMIGASLEMQPQAARGMMVTCTVPVNLDRKAIRPQPLPEWHNPSLKKIAWVTGAPKSNAVVSPVH